MKAGLSWETVTFILNHSLRPQFTEVITFGKVQVIDVHPYHQIMGYKSTFQS